MDLNKKNPHRAGSRYPRIDVLQGCLKGSKQWLRFQRINAASTLLMQRGGVDDEAPGEGLVQRKKEATDVGSQLERRALQAYGSPAFIKA
jgi:hypothetical protein